MKWTYKLNKCDLAFCSNNVETYRSLEKDEITELIYLIKIPTLFNGILVVCFQLIDADNLNKSRGVL